MPPRLTYEVPTVPPAPQGFAQQAWNSPWFALGRLLGMEWVNQYNQRGVNKLVDSMKGAIPGQESAESAQGIDPTVNGESIIAQNYLAQNPTPQIGQAAPDAVSNLRDYAQAVNDAADGKLDFNQLGQVLDGQAPTASVTPRIAPDDTLAVDVANYLANNGDSSPNPGLVNSASIAPFVTSSAAPRTSAPAQFDVDKWKAAVQAAGVAQGRPQYQIDMAIARMMPQAQAAQDNYNKYMSDGIVSQLGGLWNDALEKGDFTKYNAALYELGKYNPELAKQYQTNSPSYTDQYNQHNTVRNAVTSANIAEKAADNAMVRNMYEDNNKSTNELSNYVAKKQIDAAYGSSGSSSSGASGGTKNLTKDEEEMVNRQQYVVNALTDRSHSALTKEADNLQNWLNETEGDASVGPEERQRFINHLYAINGINEVLYGNKELGMQYLNAVGGINGPYAKFLKGIIN